ncbi:MAG: serine/threonine protein kinase [Bryobacterales bacterium]|nr:serine/threonine protein kinase [Bryobacterales bacterium]
MQSIGRYRIVRELGRGAMGVVYLAEDPAIGRLAAIKTINLDNLSEEGQEQQLRDRLIREARSAGILSHPGIVTIYDIQHFDHTTAIVMEYVEGATLLDRMLKSDLAPGEVLGILEQTAAALDYAHSRGVLHRDIKPANLMFSPEGLVKITDFGVAKIGTQKTATSGMVMGTPSYMAPEQISNKAMSPATDQFSLAVLAFELIAGQKPFAAESISGLLYNIVFQDPISVRTLNPSLPAAAETVLRKALAKEPGGRYASCAEFIKVLKTACETKKAWKPVRTMRGSSVAMAAPEMMMPPVAAPVVAETAPSKKPFPMVAAFGIGFATMLAGFFTWQLTQPENKTNTAPLAASVTPAPAVATPKPASPKPAPVVKEAAKAAAAKPEATEALLYPVEFSSEPARATVSVGEQKCTTPCTLDLPKGEQYVRAELEGHKPDIRRVRVPEQLEFTFTLAKPSGGLEVRGPAGATIYVNGQPWKTKAPARLTLPAGTYRIQLELPNGTKDTEEQVELSEGKLVVIN